MAWYNPRCETRTFPLFILELVAQNIIELMPCTRLYYYLKGKFAEFFVYRGVEKT